MSNYFINCTLIILFSRFNKALIKSMFNLRCILFFIFWGLVTYSQTPKYIMDSIHRGVEYGAQEKNIDELIRILNKFKDSVQEDTYKIKIYLNLANGYFYYDKSNEAMLVIKQAMELSKANDFYKHNSISKFLALLHASLGEHQKSINHLKPIIDNSKYNNNDFITDYYNLILSYRSLEKKDSGIYYINKLNKLLANADSTTFLPYEINLLKTIEIIKLKDFEENYYEAIKLYKIGINNNTLPNDYYSNLNIATLYQKIKVYDSAEFYFSKAQNLVINQPNKLISYYEYLYSFYKETNNTEKQRDIADKIVNLSDSLNLKIDYLLYAELSELVSQTKDFSKSPKTTWYVYLILFIGAITGLTFLLKRKKKQEVISSTKETKHIEQNTITLNDSIEEKIGLYLDKITKEKMYLNPDFNLNTLQNISNINRKYLTSYFNSKETTFVHFINKLRINYVQEREQNLEDNFTKYTLQKQAEEAGYKSIATYKKWKSKFS